MVVQMVGRIVVVHKVADHNSVAQKVVLKADQRVAVDLVVGKADIID
jgi:hypothetical protein